MQKKEREVYFALQGKHSLDNMFVTKNFYSRNEHQKMFLIGLFLVDPIELHKTNIFHHRALFLSFNRFVLQRRSFEHFKNNV